MMRLALAVHEAAHALVADGLTGSVVARVYLTGDDSGRIERTQSAAAADDLLISVAGGIGEEVLHGRARCVSALDRQQAREAVARLRGVRVTTLGDVSLDVHHLAACRRARTFLQRNAGPLRHVAHELYVRGGLTGVEVRMLVRLFEQERLQERRAALGRYSTPAPGNGIERRARCAA